MKDFLIKIFGYKGENGITIELFSVWHFLYLIFIAGAIIGLGFLLNKKDGKFRKKFLDIWSIAVLCFYIADFFLQPFVTSDHELNIDKLPFHICTLMGIIAVFAQFSDKDWFKEVAVVLAMAGSVMYLTYPGTALGGIAPWCYKVVQTMIYHGALLAWGVLNLVTKQVKLNYRKMWMPLVGIVIVAAWATVGNLCYNKNYLGGSDHYDWFFLTGTTFPFVPAWLMPFMVITAVYGVVACFYLINFICQIIAKRISDKKTTVAAYDGGKEENKSEAENEKVVAEEAAVTQDANE